MLIEPLVPVAPERNIQNHQKHRIRINSQRQFILLTLVGGLGGGPVGGRVGRLVGRFVGRLVGGLVVGGLGGGEPVE